MLEILLLYNLCSTNNNNTNKANKMKIISNNKMIKNTILNNNKTNKVKNQH
jgi:hypothetical protein